MTFRLRRSMARLTFSRMSFLEKPCPPGCGLLRGNFQKGGNLRILLAGRRYHDDARGPGQARWATSRRCVGFQVLTLLWGESDRQGNPHVSVSTICGGGRNIKVIVYEALDLHMGCKYLEICKIGRPSCPSGDG